MDLDSLRISAQCLICLAQAFTWIPANQYHHINNSLLASVFVFATFGCNSKRDNNYPNDISHLGILAMNCINEIMSKNCAPGSATDFLYQLFQNTFRLLQSMIKENNGD